MTARHVLVVGFPAENLANLNYFLKMTGHRVSTADDAVTAVGMMLTKPFSFRKLDLILMGNCIVFMQFLQQFDGIIRLAAKSRFLVVDEWGLRDKLQETLEMKSGYEVEFCSNHDMIQRFQSLLEECDDSQVNAIR